jgi:hypothetical protein
MKKIKAANTVIDALGGNVALARRLLPRNSPRAEEIRMESRIAHWRRHGVAAKYVLQIAKLAKVAPHTLVL